MGPVKLLIADTQNIIRYGLRYILDRQFELKIVGKAASWEEVTEKVDLLKPDILILDPFTLEGIDVEAIPDLKKFSSGLKLMIVSDHYSRNDVDILLSLEIDGFVTKVCSQEEIVNGIYSVARNEKFFCNKVLNVILDARNGAEDCSSTDLTPREIEIVRLIARGMSSSSIADKLCLSTHTVYTHRRNIMRKLKVSNASELVMQAVNAGIIGQQATA